MTDGPFVGSLLTAPHREKFRAKTIVGVFFLRATSLLPQGVRWTRDGEADATCSAWVADDVGN